MGDKALHIRRLPTAFSGEGLKKVVDEKWWAWVFAAQMYSLATILTRKYTIVCKDTGIYGSLLVDCYETNSWMVEHHPERQGPVLLARELHLPQATSVDVSTILVKKWLISNHCKSSSTSPRHHHSLFPCFGLHHYSFPNTKIARSLKTPMIFTQ